MHRAFAVAAAIALAVSACSDTDTATTQGPNTTVYAGGIETGWNRLPDAPLDPRSTATVVWTGTEVVVVGGWEYLCPPNADCGVPPGITFADGAAFDPATDTWRSIADAPTPFTGSPGVAVGGDVYVLTAECWTADCEPSIGLLRYRPAANAWDAYPPPPADGFFHIAATRDAVVVYSQSDEEGEVPDWRFDPATEAWVEIPNDPLPASYDRQIVVDGDDLLLLGTPLDWDGPGNPQVAAARYRPVDDNWEWLPPSGVSGFGAWLADGLVVVNPHFRTANGGIYDSERNTWEPLPQAPPTERWDNDLAGVVGAGHGVFASPRGWVLDLATGDWIEIAPLDDRIDFWVGGGITAVGRDLLLVGGERWTDDGTGGLLNEVWLWRAPAP